LRQIAAPPRAARPRRFRRQRPRVRSTIRVNGRSELAPEAQAPAWAPARALVELHVRNNDRSAGLWDLYAGHRRRLTELVAARGARTLAVLGAGNANDLDLGVLARRFEEVHLADLDPAALERAARRQGAATRARLVLHPERELSGLLGRVPAWREHAPDLETLARWPAAAAARVAAQLPGPFDVVVSDCLLSQIAWTFFRGLGDGPLLMNVLDIALATHLRALVALARPGGRCLLVTDVVSSETFPVDRLGATPDGEAILRDLEARRALFSGTSPAVARLMLTEDPALASRVDDISLEEPWPWRVSRTRTVVVYALSFRRR
jgi:hypothetical protein